MLIGYARISKADGSQSLDLQRDALRQAGVSDDAIYEDQASGQREDRPGLAAFLKAARQGDVIVVWRLDRLGRNLRHLVNLVQDLNDRDIGIRVLAISTGLCKSDEFSTTIRDTLTSSRSDESVNNSTGIQPVPEQDNYLHKGAVLQPSWPGQAVKGLGIAKRYCRIDSIGDRFMQKRPNPAEGSSHRLPFLG